MRDKLLYDFTTSEGVVLMISPRQLLEALDDAVGEMSYSNYHCDKFSRAQEIVRRYCREHSIPLGPSKKQREHNERQRTQKRERFLKKLKRQNPSTVDLTKMLKALKAMDDDDRKYPSWRVAPR